MKSRVRELKEHGDKLFSQRGPLLSLWQATAEQFYVERADFTRQFSLGEEFASHLMTGAPVMARRDLANQFHAMLRPRQKPWFHARTQNNRVNEDATALKWLDRASDIMRTFMYETPAQFVRATSQGDNDFATFGQCVLQPTENRNKDGLLFRNWHLRDVAWCENGELVVDKVHRNWKCEARNMVKLFKNVHSKITQAAEKDPHKEFPCRHIVLPADEYDLEKSKRKGADFVSIYIDVDNETILEEVPYLSLGYVIPRWQTVSGSQYAYSPATVVALPDARLLQQITLTLLESGQKAVDPPMVAVAEAIMGGANLGAGMITWADAEYDERLGEVLRPAYGDAYRGGGLNWGVDREERITKAISDAFYLNQINLPEMGGDMTAFETQKRVEEYVRRALPLFEPMETEYNGALCNETFDILMRNGAFGPRDQIPDKLRGQEIRFVFESPLQAAGDRAKAEAVVGSANLLATVATIDPTVRFNVDWNGAFRGALPAVGLASEYIVDEDVAKQAQAADAKKAAMQQVAGMVQQGADIATSVGTAGQSLKEAGLV